MKKRLHNSRRGRALLYALLLAAVILVSSETGFYCFLPQQAIQEEAEQQGIETLEPVMWIQGENPTGTGPARLTLSAGRAHAALLPCEVLPAGRMELRSMEHCGNLGGRGTLFRCLAVYKTSATYVFGRADDPAVENADHPRPGEPMERPGAGRSPRIGRRRTGVATLLRN